MTVSVENIGGGGKIDKVWHPPPNTQTKGMSDNFNVPTPGQTLGARWGTIWIGNNYADSGLPPIVMQPPPKVQVQFTPTSNVPAAQSWVIGFPWVLAWMTQYRSTQFSAIGLDQFGVDDPPTGLICCLLCFNANMRTLEDTAVSACYALIAQANAARDSYNLSIEKLRIGNVPMIGAQIGQVAGLRRELLLNLGPIPLGRRLWFQAADLGNAWELGAFDTQYFPTPQPIEYVFRGSVIDNELTQGMPAFGASNTTPSQTPGCTDFAGGCPDFLMATGPGPAPDPKCWGTP